MFKIIHTEHERKQFERKLKQDPRWQKIAPGIFSNESGDSLNDCIKNHLFEILHHLKIQGTLMYSTSIPMDDDNEERTKILWIASTKERTVTFGDWTVHVMKGNAKEICQDHTSWIPETLLRRPDDYLMVLQNHSIRKVDQHKINPQKATEIFLKRMAAQKMMAVYDYNLKAVAQKLGYTEEYEKVKQSINTYELSIENTDQERLFLFHQLAQDIKNKEFASPSSLPSIHLQHIDRIESMAFFESYFSNYIEGTIFEIDEAQSIVFDSNFKYIRHQDGHDIIKTYDIIKQSILHPVHLHTADDFIHQLKYWHKEMFSHRDQELLVGEFKVNKNRAGNTIFVLPEHVENTLKAAFNLLKNIQTPLGKAVFLKTVIAEIHPFEDGNGRISRIMMNNELSCHGLQRIIIPTVFRDDYITALKAFSQNKKTSPIYLALNKAAMISSSIPWEKSMTDLISFLHQHSAFDDPRDSLWGIPKNPIQTHQHHDSETRPILPKFRF